LIALIVADHISDAFRRLMIVDPHTIAQLKKAAM